MDKRTLRSKKTKPRSARPYDRQNQSIFGKVFSTFKGLLNPSRLINNVSQWMGNAEEEEPGNSSDVEEIVREDNDIVSQSSSHGNKRLRLRYEDHIPSIQSSGTQTWPDQPPSQSLYETVSRVQSPTSQSSLLETKEPLAVLNGDDHSENSEGSASTSGCSSLVSSNNRLVESPFQNVRSDMKRKRREPDTSKSRFTDVNSSRLWSREFSSPKFQRRIPTISHTNQPNFNLSTFVGPSKLNQSMENKVTSPFYEGNTTFGGASAARRMPPSVAPYQVDKTLRSQIKVREHQSNDNLEGMSSAAKRILLTLEKMSTPVADAKKIPNSSTSPVDLSLYLTPPKSRRNSQFTPSISKGPPIANINTIAKLATLKNYGVSRLRSTVSGEPVLSGEQKNASLEILQPCSSEANSPKGGGGKMRNRLNQHHLPAKDDCNQMPEAPVLPNVPLPITSLPTFKFGVSKPEKKSDGFTFSNPIEHDLSISSAVPSTLPLPSSSFESKFEATNSRLKPFVFSNPILHELPDSGMLPKESASIPKSGVALPKVSNTSTATWECSSCCVRNPSYKSSCIACETPQASKKDSSVSGFNLKNLQDKPQVSPAVSGSVSSPGSVFGTPKTVPKTNSESFSTPNACTGSAKSKPFSFGSGSSSSTTWECGTCLVRNPEKESKCIACEMLRPTNENLNNKKDSSSNVPVLSTSATWECSGCWVRNPVKESKCLACETVRPTKESSSEFTSTSITTSTTTSSTWECSSCWVKNPLKEKKCIACETTRSTEGTISSGISVSSASPTTWECSSCWVRNPVKEKKCLACETLQSNKETTSGFKDVNGFKFSSPVQNSPITFKFGNFVCTAPSTATTSTFKFGISTTSETTTTASSGFKFGVPSSTSVSSIFSSTPSTTTSKTSETLPALFQTNNNTGLFKIPSIEISSAEVKQPESNAIIIETPQPSSKLNNSTQIKLTESSETPKISSALSIPSQAVKISEGTSVTAVITSSSSVATVSVEKEIPAPSVTACFGFTTQPVINSKKSETFNFQTTNEKPVSSITPSFGNFPISSSSQEKSNVGEKLDHVDKNSNPEPKAPSMFQLPSQTFSTSSFAMPSTTAPLFKFGETTDTSKVCPSTTSAALSTSTSTTFTFDSGTSTFGTVAKSKSSEIPSITAGPLQQKSEDLKASKSTPFSSSTTTTPSFAFGVSAAPTVTTSAPAFSFFSSSAATTTPASTVFTFGASTNTTQVAKSGGFTFKSFEKSKNTQTLSSTSQPVAQGLNLGASATATSGGFVFGAPKTEAQSATSSPFVFGSNPTTTTAATSNTSAFSAFQPSQPANPTFQFGSQTASSATPSFGSSSSFAFAKSEPSLVPSSSAQNPASAFGSSGTFSFGQKTEPSTQITATVSQTPVLAFGTSGSTFPFNNKNENAVAPNIATAFGSATIPSVFGNASVPPFGATPDKPAAGGFTFQTPASNIFQFGASNVEKKPASSGFSFGTAQETNNSFSSGFTMNTPPSFNFGAASTPVAGPFQFAASSEAPGAQSSAPRKYRKAVRRVLRRD